MILPLNSFTIHALLGLIVTVAFTGVFYVLYFKSGRSLLDLLAANINLGLAIVCLSYFMMDNLIPAGFSARGWPGGPSAEELSHSSLNWMRLAWTAAPFLLISQLHFVLVYCRSRGPMRFLIGVWYLAAAAAVPLIWSAHWITARATPLADTSSWENALPWLPKIGPLVFVFYAFWLVLTIRNLVELILVGRFQKAQSRDDYRQWQWVFFGYLFQCTLVADGILAVVYDYAGPVLLPVGATLMSICLGTALIRRRIDVERTQTQLEREKAVLLESVHQPLFFVDTQDKIHWANEEAKEFLACDEDPSGEMLPDVWPGPARQAGKIIRTALQSNQPHREEISQPDGGTWIIHASPLSTTEQGALGVIVLAMDITRLRRAEGVLRSVNARILSARDEERCRVAKDLHDSIAQSIAALQLRMLAGTTQGETQKPPVELLEFAVKECGRLATEIRQICHDLYPPTLELLGLIPSIDELLSSYRESGKDCVVKCEDALKKTRFPRPVEIALYRMVQEAVNNAIRHGQASQISVHIATKDQVLYLSVMDNGQGFNPEDTTCFGMGMRSMKSRIEAIGGALRITSRRGKTRISVVIPLDAPSQSKQKLLGRYDQQRDDEATRKLIRENKLSAHG
jgi:signal transduction histidine kinase